MKLRQKILVISLSIAICEWGFSKTKCYQEPLVSFIEVQHIRWDIVEEYELEGNIWVMVQHEESKSF